MGSRTRFCPVCGAATRRVAPCFRVNQLPSDALPRRTEDEHCTCTDCGFCWIEPEPPVEALIEAYRSLPADQWGEAGEGAEWAQAREYDRKIADLTQFVGGGRALDVGCFHGEFLARLPDTFERWGIEIAHGAAEVARARGINVVEADAMTAEVPGTFDLVYCSDVVEHIVDQHRFAARLASWLAPGGLLVIETGDAGAPLARLMAERWYYLALVEHVCAHTRRSLNHVMHGAGLRPVKVERRWHELPPTAAQPIKRTAMALAFKGATGAAGLLKRIMPLPAPVDRLYRRWAPRHSTRDHLWALYAHPGSEHLP